MDLRIVLFIALFAATIIAQPRKSKYGDNVYFKSLQGPPSEFPDFIPPSPKSIADVSQGNVIPITFDFNAFWQGNFVVDSATFSICELSPLEIDEYSIQIQLPGSPSSQTLADIIQSLNGNVIQEQIGLGTADRWPVTCYAFTNAPLGTWVSSIQFTGVIAKDIIPLEPAGFFILNNESPYKLKAYTSDDLLVGKTVNLLGEVIGADGSTIPTSAISTTASATVIEPSGVEVTVQMADDGLHGDGQANDGVFGGYLTVNEAGGYQISTEVSGVTPDGNLFVRSVQQFFVVLMSDLALQNTATASMKNHKTVEIDIEIQGTQAAATGYIVYSQVWGKDATGSQDVPIAWISGISEPSSDGSVLSMDMDMNWITVAQAHQPFSLKNVQILGRNVQDLLDSMDDIPIQWNGEFPTEIYTRSPRDIVIDEEMINGPRPDHLKEVPTAGGKVMLVHGYCSNGDAWPVEDFTNYIVFKDPQANRALDEFANLLLQFASSQSLSSYSIVAHSQGGLASLHLASYYWSGLDVATGGRIIQTVGSPYQGTALAGFLASLGSLFGYGCGSNDGMTKDGAGAWRSKIPANKQSLVYYWTTQGDSACSSAANFFGLDTPNDGVTSKDFSQLSSGNNQGHEKSWCHTDGLNAPFQNLDHKRNQLINSNAAH